MSVPTPIARPATALVAPKMLDEAFAEPDAVLELIEWGAPYKTLSAVHKDPPERMAHPWFRNFWALGGKVLLPGAEGFVHNPLFIDAARELFKADVVSPLTMMTNLNVPGPASPPHLDLPFFRGAHRREVPPWLLAPMGYSGLFHNWAIPVASVITWFYNGEGGEFEFWSDGLDQPSLKIGELAANQALMADNEYTYHRVCQIGSVDDFLPDNEVPYTATLDLDGTQWFIADGPDELARYERHELRLSVLWKAFCFIDQAEADAFTSGSDNLTPAQVVDIFHDDLRRRGISAELPANLDGLDRWGRIIRETYGVPAY